MNHEIAPPKEPNTDPEVFEVMPAAQREVLAKTLIAASGVQSCMKAVTSYLNALIREHFIAPELLDAANEEVKAIEGKIGDLVRNHGTHHPDEKQWCEYVDIQQRTKEHITDGHSEADVIALIAEHLDAITFLTTLHPKLNVPLKLDLVALRALTVLRQELINGSQDRADQTPPQVRDFLACDWPVQIIKVATAAFKRKEVTAEVQSRLADMDADEHGMRPSDHVLLVRGAKRLLDAVTPDWLRHYDSDYDAVYDTMTPQELPPDHPQFCPF